MSSTTYRRHRIHTTQLTSGVWVASVVALGGSVEHLRRDFPTHAEAVKGAEQAIEENTSEETGHPGDQSRPPTCPPLPAVAGQVPQLRLDLRDPRPPGRS